MSSVISEHKESGRNLRWPIRPTSSPTKGLHEFTATGSHCLIILVQGLDTHSKTALTAHELNFLI